MPNKQDLPTTRQPTDKEIITGQQQIIHQQRDTIDDLKAQLEKSQ